MHVLAIVLNILGLIGALVLVLLVVFGSAIKFRRRRSRYIPISIAGAAAVLALPIWSLVVACRGELRLLVFLVPLVCLALAIPVALLAIIVLMPREPL